MRKFLSELSLAKLSLLVLLSIAVVMSLNLTQRKAREDVEARGGRVQVSFEASSMTLPPDSTVKVVLNTGKLALGFVRMDVLFDKSKINLTKEISVTNLMKTQIFVTPMVDANSSGRATIVLGTSTADRANPLMGKVEFAQMSFRAVTSAKNATAKLRLDASTAQMVDMNSNNLMMGTTPVSLVINPQVSGGK